MRWTYDNEVSFLFRTQLQEKLPTIDKLCSSKLVKFERTQFIFSNVFIAIIIIVCSHVSSLLLALPALSFLGGRGGGVQVQAVSTSSTCRFTPYPGWIFSENIENTIFKCGSRRPPPPSWNCTPLSLQFQFFECTGYILVTYQKITCHMGSTSSGYMEKYRSAKSVGCSELSFKLVQHWRYFVRLSKTISARRSFP